MPPKISKKKNNKKQKKQNKIELLSRDEMNIIKFNAKFINKSSFVSVLKAY